MIPSRFSLIVILMLFSLAVLSPVLATTQPLLFQMTYMNGRNSHDKPLLHLASHTTINTLWGVGKMPIKEAPQASACEHYRNGYVLHCISVPMILTRDSVIFIFPESGSFRERCD